ncbi:PREDICTED: mesothelin [Crocodylus porosus]|uniref:mesothelin n=1 Tax=Crocodylus porosus TaxID=8502 RepID=UPI00093A0AE1|nr:PREDICTED: mesothelin [Crocodylus porosus]
MDAKVTTAAMTAILRGLSLLFLVGGLMAAENSVVTYRCTSSPVNEADICASVKSVSKEMLLEIASGKASPCSLTFGQYACAQSSELQAFKDDLLMSLYPCLSSKPVSTLDPMLSILLFSKFDANVLADTLEKFNKRFSRVPLSQDWNVVFFNGIWERMAHITSLSALSKRLHASLQPFMANPRVFACLHAMNVSCKTFCDTVAALDSLYPKLPAEERGNIYKGLKSYLTKNGSKVICYNAAAHSLNSTAWFANYLGSFMEYVRVGDLRLFADELTLQRFARDPVNVEMISNLTLPRETAVYYTLLLTSAPGFQLASLPDKFVCYLSPSAVRSLNKNEALNLAQRINKNCALGLRSGPNKEQMPASSLTTEELQVATSLVNKFDRFPPDVLSALGQMAVGLSASQIENGICDKDFVASLPSLSKVRGWNTEQSSTIINKLFNSSYQVVDGQSLAALGSLAAGLSSRRLQSLPSKVVLEAMKMPEFVQQIGTMPPALKTVLVEKMSSAISSPIDLIKYVPDALVDHIPKSLLVFGNFRPHIQDLNQKSWSREQAAMFFDDVVKDESDFNRLSPSVLQGFTCAAANEMETEKFQQLAKAMKQKNVRLGEEQLRCLVKRVTAHGMPKDLDNYPKDLLLFLSPSDYAATGSCRQYVLNIGEANLGVLQRDSPQSKQLLLEALACLKIPGTRVSEEKARVLGHLVCDLGGEYIRGSGGSLLKWLSQCKSFTPDQEEAIRDVISNGTTPFGPPSTWSASTLSELSGLFLVLDQSILHKIPRDVFDPWLRNFLSNSTLSREQLASVVKKLQPSRWRRATDCPSDKTVTDDVAMNELMPILYSPQDLQACLTAAILEKHLARLITYPFTDEQLSVLKNKLDEAYPDGYPEKILPNLGALTALVTVNDTKKWNISSADTLAALLLAEPPDVRAREIIKRYTDLGNPLITSALNAVGTRYVCLLDETQLDTIEPGTLEMASLDPSNCSQLTKDILYSKAKLAFSGKRTEFPAYYNLIKPYLGGAPAEDLRALSNNSVNMDIGTFAKLRRDSVLALTTDQVKGLLGVNLKDLKDAQYTSSLIKAWISLQKQPDLDKLGLGLTGGIPDGYILVTPQSTPTSPGSTNAGANARGNALHLLAVLLLSYLLTLLLP